MATINFTNLADYVYGYDYAGANTYNLLKGEDHFDGGYARDTVYGGDGADNIYGEGGNDTLNGNLGYDTLYGGSGSDTLYGGDGNDYLYSEDGQSDVVFGGNGDDYINADDDKIDGGTGRDYVELLAGENNRADVTLGIGVDTLDLTIGDVYYKDDHARVDIRDFKAEDRLIFDEAFDNAYGSYYKHGEILDRLDVNNDGWLGAKDVEQYDYDDITVHVGQNFLELDVLDTSVVLHGMTKASFDFLA